MTVKEELEAMMRGEDIEPTTEEVTPVEIEESSTTSQVDDYDVPICDENGNVYANEQDAADAGLSEAQYGATYCPAGTTMSDVEVKQTTESVTATDEDTIANKTKTTTTTPGAQKGKTTTTVATDKEVAQKTLALPLISKLSKRLLQRGGKNLTNMCSFLNRSLRAENI